jgi:phage gpG-like protein
MEFEFNSGALHVSLSKVIGEAFSVQPIISTIGELLLTSVEENFLAGGRYGQGGQFQGGPQKWVPLGASTIRARQAKGRGATPILQMSGRMAASFQWAANGNGVSITNNARYFAIHQFGGTIRHPGGTPYIILGTGLARFLKKDGQYPAGVRFTRPHAITIPARPMLVMQDDDMVAIAELVANRASKILRGR